MAYISADDVKAIRTELKQAFPGWKFGVRKGSGSLSVDVTVLQGNIDFIESYCSKEIEPTQAQWVRKDRTIQINQYWIDSHWAHDSQARDALIKINEIMHNAPGRAGGKTYFDHSDVQSDYFHTAFYTHLSVGEWNKPYALVK
jgi:hypothetical protein